MKAQRLKRVFGIEIETCRRRCGAVRVIACIENPAVIEKILIHLETKGPPPTPLDGRRGVPEGHKGAAVS